MDRWANPGRLVVVAALLLAVATTLGMVAGLLQVPDGIGSETTAEPSGDLQDADVRFHCYETFGNRVRVSGLYLGVSGRSGSTTRSRGCTSRCRTGRGAERSP